MLVSELLTDACYLSVNDEDFEPAISPGRLTSSLRMFNLLLDELRDKIPYTFQYTFDDVADLQNTNFVVVDDLAYVINGIIIPMQPVNLVRWRELATVEGLIGIPQLYFFDESVQTVRVYPTPSNPQYQFILNGRQALGAVTLTTVLPANMPDYMKNYCIYEMGFRLCGKLGADWDPKNESIRQQLATALKNKQVIDVTARSSVMFSPMSSAPPFPYYYYLSGGGR